MITAAVLLLLDNNNAAEMHQTRIHDDTLYKLLDLNLMAEAVTEKLILKPGVVGSFLRNFARTTDGESF